MLIEPRCRKVAGLVFRKRTSRDARRQGASTGGHNETGTDMAKKPYRTKTFRTMDRQLATWSERIERMADASPEAPTAERIDELRALHTAAHTAFAGFREASVEARVGLRPQTVLVWNALAAAVRTQRPTMT